MSRIAAVDAYIAKRQPFAQPILSRVRDVAHSAAPELVEALKWSMPSFVHKGKIVLGMAAFKEHAALNFWYGSLVTGGTGVEDDAMGSFGRITSLDDLPDNETLAAMIRKSIALIDAGATPPHMANRGPRPELPVPPTLQAAIDADPKAKAHWAEFAPSHRRDYCEWIGEAKREETAAKRVAEAIGWIANGKKRHWKYENC